MIYSSMRHIVIRRIVSLILAIAFIATSCDFSYALAPELRLAQKDGKFKELTGELYLRTLALSTIGYGLYLNLTEDGFREILHRRISKKDPNAASRFVITRKDQDGVYFTESGTPYRAFLIEKDSTPPKGAEPKSLKDGRIFWLEKTPSVSATLDNSTLFIYHPYYKGEAVGEEVSLNPILKYFFNKHKSLTVVLLRRHKEPEKKSVKRESLELKNGNRLVTVTVQGDHRQFKDAGFVRREIEDCFNQTGAGPMRVWMNSWRGASGRAAVEMCNELSDRSGRTLPVMIWPRSDDLGTPEEAKNNENVKTLKMATKVAALSDYMRGRLTDVGVANVYSETVYSIADVVEKRLNTGYDARIMAEGAALAKTWESHGVKRAVFIPGSPAREKKNVYQALQWIEEIYKKLNKDRTTVFIATPDLDDVGEKMLKEYARGRDLDIRLCGQLSQDDVAVYAVAAGKTGCVLIPSKDEPLGRVPAEVAGLAPVMVSDVGGLQETIGIPASILPLNDDAKAIEMLARLFTDSEWRETIKVAQGELFWMKFGNFTWETLERFLTSQLAFAPPDNGFEPTKNITVPKRYHPDLKVIQRKGMNGLLVPIRPDQIFDVKELLSTGTFSAPYQKRIMVPGDDEMTHVSGEVLTGIMAAAEFKFTIGLATGGTTESLRKLMGLADMVKDQYGNYIDGDKIKKICTLDNYYFMDYLRERGLSEEDSNKVIEKSSYESEQLYMMIRNMMGSEVRPGFFVAPPGFTDKRWFESADDFKKLLFKFFCVAEFAQLWQMHGIGVNSHDAFNEVYRRFRIEINEMSLQIYRTGEIKRARLADGTDLAKLGLKTVPEFTRIPTAFSSMGMFRDDHPTLISFIIQVQNSGHFIPRKFHPFFLKVMGDNSLYDLEDLFAWILASVPDNILNYTDNKIYHFKNMQEFVDELNYLLEQFGNVPLEATTQGTGATLMRGNVPLPDGSFPMQLFMCSAAHKQLALVRALNPSPGLSTAAVVLNLAKNALLVATSEALGKVTDAWTMDTFIKVAPEASRLQEKVEERWRKTKEGERVSALLAGDHPKPSVDIEYDDTSYAAAGEQTTIVELKGVVISAGSATGNAWKAKADTFESLKERAGKARTNLTMNDVNKAIRGVTADLNEIILRSGRGSMAAQIIEPFKFLCDDSAFIEKIDGYIKGGMNAAEAVIKVGKEGAGRLRALKDVYLQRRALSFTDAYLRIVRKLLNEDRQEAIHGPDIVVTNVLYPTDIVDRYAGAKAIIVTDDRVGELSDAAHIAKSLNIPVIVVDDDRMRNIPNGAEIIVDADKGTVSIKMPADTAKTEPIAREVKKAEELANTIKISAAEADAENHKIIIGLQTDEWVPGEQASDIQALERAVKQFADTLKRRGVMQNVSIVLGNSKNLAANIASEKPASGDKVVILGSEKTLTTPEFATFKDAYFAYVDLSKLESLDYISLIEMIDMAVHFAVDNAAASNSGIRVETLGERIVRFIPSRRLDVDKPSEIYKHQISELAKQA
jgi:phosphohistidine swiveling domain-containing protein